MGIFGRRTNSKLRKDKHDYSTISTEKPNAVLKITSSFVERSNKKSWKLFRGFHANNKSKPAPKPVDSPRTVLLDETLLDIGCFQLEGDTSYEISLLSDNTFASTSRPETFCSEIYNPENSPSRLNRSASFGSFIMQRTLSKKKELKHAASFDAGIKTDIFDDYYETENIQSQLETEPILSEPKTPITSLRQNKSKKNWAEASMNNVEKISFDDLLKENKKEKVANNDSVEETAQKINNLNMKEKKENKKDQNIEVRKSESSTLVLSQSNVIEIVDSQLTGAGEEMNNMVGNENSFVLGVQKNNEEEKSSVIPFMDRLACEPLSEFFECATSLDKFEKMLFGDNLLIPCTNQCGPSSCAPNTPKPVKSATIDEQVKIGVTDFVALNDVSNCDSHYNLVDSFLTEATKKGIQLIYYQPINEEESEWEGHDITLYVTPGRRDEHVAVLPKLMWVARTDKINRKTYISPAKNVYHHFDIQEINSVLKPDENLDGLEENEPVQDADMEQVCFSLITNTGQVFIFEANDMKHRNYIVESLQLIVSRLAYV